MKKIEAIISPSKLESVKDGLSEIGIDGMTVIEAREFGQGTRHEAVFRGSNYAVDLAPTIKLEIMAEDRLADLAARIILEASQTDNGGEGKVFVSTIEQCLHSRAGSRRAEAPSRLVSLF